MNEQEVVSRRQLVDSAARIVVKVGTGVLTYHQNPRINPIRQLVKGIAGLIEQGREVILVSSGAIGLGVGKINLKAKPTDIPQKQAAAAVGQPSLMLAYEKSFSRYQKKVAQVLLTRDDLCNRRRYLNARNTLNVLLDWNVVPIVNENDTVVVDELKFGDNDNLSAMITHLMDAHVLISLTDTDGFYDKDPQTHEDASLYPLISKITTAMEEAACDIPGALGTGGMSSKITTAKKVTTGGVPMVIANGLRPNTLRDIFQGKSVGTLFMPQARKMASRKCWIAFTLKQKGVIKVDEGAAEAITKQGKSLLPIGITHVQGNFGEGAMVSCVNHEDMPFAKGLVNYAAADIRKLQGLRTNQIKTVLGHKFYDEVIHRDNLVITVGGTEETPCL
jgi:glutamate 5-kinase